MACASFITWAITIIFGLFTQALFDALTPEGMYFLFTGIDVVGFFFILFLVKETYGLSREELKTLYYKGDYKQLDKVNTDTTVEEEVPMIKDED